MQLGLKRLSGRRSEVDALRVGDRYQRGLGSCFTTLHLAYEREAAELLGIPDTVTQAALIPVAYTKGDEFKPAARRPVEEITYWNRWKQT